MKKLVNDVHNVVKEILEGFAPTHADLVEVRPDSDFVICKTPKVEGKVGLMSGGGSGHEPLHAGFVGEGMLGAAIPGAVFISPTPDPILEVTKVADHSAGTLHIVKDYTDDVLNFETAARIAEMEDIEARSIVVNNDVVVEDSLYTTGRRGVVGTIFVEKLAGAAAERGDDLDAVTVVAQKTNSEMCFMGLALGLRTVPHAGRLSPDLADDEIELGIGIHGEPGYRRGKMESADALVEELYTKVRDDLGLRAGERVITLVNGMDGTLSPELYIRHRRLAELPEAGGVSIVRSLVGNYVTSLETSGVSTTLLYVDDELLELFNAPVSTPVWKRETHNDSRRRMGDPVDAAHP